ncbi:phosphatase PAP2 family protein [Clostridium estertheticum]|uniref:phosphatase PAP2 family protein n=1 Tax=Clostridium estertheticum TaxID=238834 RepID=UPI0013E91F91|nr:phosphatase PAP2 family protein [Clostridium estertheticum]MBZ9685653.1 phosphatase PAP2 family protein [Clostridium estertheticum]
MPNLQKKGFGIIALLMIVFTFTDLQISKVIYNPDSVYGLIFEAIGEFPAGIIATFCTVSLIVTRKKEKSIKYNLGTIGYGLMLILFSLMATMLPIKYLNGPTFLAPILAVIYIVISYFLAKKISVTNKVELRQAAIVGVLTFFFVVITFNLVKMGWGRERYRHMVAEGSFDGFSLWFIRQGFTTNNEFMSFPSGHSTNGAIMIWLTLIPTFIPRLKSKQVLINSCVIVWIILVAASRVVVGAHFASDVTMGVTITLIIFSLLKKKYVKRIC